MASGRHDANPRELKDRLAIRRLGVPFVRFRDGGGAETLMVLAAERSPLTIGRSPGTAIEVSWDPKVSRAHAELRCVGGEWTIEDAGLSRNGTFVNERRLTARQRLRNADVVRVGATSITFEAPGDPTAAGTERDSDTREVQLTERQRPVLAALCRPLAADPYARPASNAEIAAELQLSTDGVKSALRVLFARFAVEDLAPNEKRHAVARRAFDWGVIRPEDLA